MNIKKNTPKISTGSKKPVEATGKKKPWGEEHRGNIKK